MPDSNAQETKEQDPVSAIRTALVQALGFLKKLLGQEEKELQEEIEEVEGGEKPAAQAPTTSPQQPPSDQQDNSDSD